jgi:hypothetical protein
MVVINIAPISNTGVDKTHLVPCWTKDMASPAQLLHIQQNVNGSHNAMLSPALRELHFWRDAKFFLIPLGKLFQLTGARFTDCLLGR